MNDLNTELDFTPQYLYEFFKKQYIKENTPSFYKYIVPLSLITLAISYLIGLVLSIEYPSVFMLIVSPIILLTYKYFHTKRLIKKTKQIRIKIMENILKKHIKITQENMNTIINSKKEIYPEIINFLIYLKKYFLPIIILIELFIIGVFINHISELVIKNTDTYYSITLLIILLLHNLYIICVLIHDLIFYIIDLYIITAEEIKFSLIRKENSNSFK